MMNILLIDAYSAQHVGNLALVDSAFEQLRVQFPEAEFTILAFDPDSIAKHSRCKTLETLWAEQFSGYSILKKIVWIIRESVWILVNIFNFSVLKPLNLSVSPEKYTFSKKKLEALNAYSNADIVISISGEMLQDSEWKRIPLFLFGYWLAHNMGKIVVLFPQSIGPFKKGFIKHMVSYVLNLCDLVFPRDEISFRTTRQLKINPEKVYLVPDVAVNQPYVSKEEARKLLEDEGVNLDKGPLVGVTISKWKKLDYKKYFTVMRELCHFIIKDLNGTVVLFSANKTFRKDIDDRELTCRLHEALRGHGNAKLLLKTYTAREFKGMLGELDLFISTRMHTSIFATMIGTPTITVNTQPKVRGYMDLIRQGQRSCEIKDFTIEKAKELVKDTLAQKERLRSSLEDARSEMVKRASIASKLLRKIYDEKESKTI
ncbi:MAG: polysaccharide pyruvyl transferase family protein [Candidatus Omnitrophota bacterium]